MGLATGERATSILDWEARQFARVSELHGLKFCKFVHGFGYVPLRRVQRRRRVVVPGAARARRRYIEKQSVAVPCWPLLLLIA